MERSRASLKKIIVYFFLFYLLYLPKITELLFNIQSQIVIFIVFIILAFVRIDNIFSERIDMCFSKQVMVKWIISIFYLSSYATIIALLNDKPNRFFQYFYTVIWLLTLYWYKKTIIDDYLSNEQLIELLFIFGAIQGLICIAMLIFPALKEIANQLYYLGGERNVFRTEKRIYGISNDYTFFTPCYHGFLASFCLLYSVVKKKIFMIAVPLIFIATFMNNRTGIIIFLINTVIIGVMILLDINVEDKVKINLLKGGVLLFAALGISLMVIKLYNPKTYEYTIQGVLTAKEWASEQNYQLYFPSGLDLIFGNGDIQAGVTRIKYGWSIERNSDYGYVNDLFIGGLIYCAFLYLANFKFLFFKNNSIVFGIKMYQFDLISLITLLISNYKGQSMKSGFLIIAVFFIKLTLLDSIDSDKANVNCKERKVGGEIFED